MKKCEDAVALLSPLVDGALGEDDREWLEEHLRECAGCRDRRALIAAQGDAIRERLNARGAAADFAGFADKVLARSRSERPLSVPARFGAWGTEMWGAHRTAFAASGGLLAAAGLALAVLFTPPASQPADAVLLADAREPQVEEVDFGSHDGAVLELQDKTPVIWLSEDRQ